MFSFIKNIFRKKKTENSALTEVLKYKDLYQSIGYLPKHSESNYIKALTHASYSKHIQNKNERLEFLGDSVINFVIAEFLYNHFDSKNEGELSKLRSQLVSRTHLNKIGLNLNLHRYIKHKLAPNFYQTSPDILGNTLEALVGAYFLDYTMLGTKPIICKLLLENVDLEQFENEIKDFKSFLYEWVQAEKKQLELKHVANPENDTQFVVDIYIDTIFMAQGKGKNKKEAEKNACLNAYNNLVEQKIIV
ncbi:MAG TPA: ribonuclease III [Chitinophagales bacterium]|nr:ribonuclease III [Bacteroidota bacterium]MCB9075781.1 ribonuclease III [Chitinophagales bacterium]HMU97902.1 ribonuclease III [Chitinophagales bacterium]HMW94623.1 ribonuclease III [Chitinophagales bacterium]HMZ68535.1 ribonuclease III [Chitinophagales bacterium]